MTYMYAHFVPMGDCGDATIANQQELLARNTAILDLLQADQVFDKDAGTINYYLKGSGQTVLLHAQNVNGTSSCAESTSLIGS